MLWHTSTARRCSRVTPDAIVVGGGIGGLVAALDLCDAGYHVALLDAAESFGGSVARGLVGRITAELGADAFANARPEIPVLAKRLAIDGDIVSPRTYQAYLRQHGHNVALPPGLMGIPVDYGDIARLLGAEIAAEAEQRDSAPLPAQLPESFGELVRLRLGDAVLTALVDPVVSGVHASRADSVETDSILPGLLPQLRRHGSLVAAAHVIRGAHGPAGTPVAGFRFGLSQLIDRLIEALDEAGATLLANTPVTAVAPTATGWQVHTERHRWNVPHVVVALPAGAASQVLAGANGPCRTLAAALTTFHTTDVTLVALHVTVTGLPSAATPVGSGVLIPPDQDDVRAKALTHVSAKWDDVLKRMPHGTHLFRLSYGGTSPVPQGKLQDVAVADLAALLDVPQTAVAVHASRVVSWNGALTRPHVGRTRTVTAIDTTLTQLSGLALIGNAYAGNGLAGVVGRARREVSRILTG